MAATQKPAREEHGNEDPICSGGANEMKTHNESGGARLTEMKTERGTGRRGTAEIRGKTLDTRQRQRDLRESKNQRPEGGGAVGRAKTAVARLGARTKEKQKP
jgi:hypothetical protein